MRRETDARAATGRHAARHLGFLRAPRRRGAGRADTARCRARVGHRSANPSISRFHQCHRPGTPHLGAGHLDWPRRAIMTTAMGSRQSATMANSASLAFVFPGQGSQYPGMIKDVQRCGPGARSLLGDAQDITGLPVLDLMSTASAEIIADPHIAQVLVFLTSTVLLNELRQRGWRPAAVAGHSLGEYPALVAAEMLTWDAALRLVHARGTAMAAAAAIQPGAMAALVGLNPETVTAMCQSATRDPEHAVIANLNSATQLVVSGTEAAVEEVLESAR